MPPRLESALHLRQHRLEVVARHGRRCGTRRDRRGRPIEADRRRPSRHPHPHRALLRVVTMDARDHVEAETGPPLGPFGAGDDAGETVRLVEVLLRHGIGRSSAAVTDTRPQGEHDDLAHADGRRRPVGARRRIRPTAPDPRLPACSRTRTSAARTRRCGARPQVASGVAGRGLTTSVRAARSARRRHGLTPWRARQPPRRRRPCARRRRERPTRVRR
ncbi:hypothetical protein EDF46_0452 [Frondihabitans sp. PhB188]|nr:hypothetical protein EDF46_0452 [Frondihabitans sp. PhB188]